MLSQRAHHLLLSKRAHLSTDRWPSIPLLSETPTSRIRDQDVRARTPSANPKDHGCLQHVKTRSRHIQVGSQEERRTQEVSCRCCREYLYADQKVPLANVEYLRGTPPRKNQLGKTLLLEIEVPLNQTPRQARGLRRRDPEHPPSAIRIFRPHLLKIGLPKMSRMNATQPQMRSLPPPLKKAHRQRRIPKSGPERRPQGPHLKRKIN